MVGIPAVLFALTVLSGMILSEVRSYTATIRSYSERRALEEINEVDRLINIRKAQRRYEQAGGGENGIIEGVSYLRESIIKFNGIKVYVARDFLTQGCDARTGFSVRLPRNKYYSYVVYVIEKNAGVSGVDVQVVNEGLHSVLDLRNATGDVKVVEKLEFQTRLCS